MLIYNHNKEFVGIDDEDLQHLGYRSLAAFLQDHNDIADLFVKQPGYIHNFKNFPWIDFVMHADAEESKAIIKTKSKSFSCEIIVKAFFLVDSPTEESYAVSLKHLKNADGSVMGEPELEENEKIVMDVDDDLGMMPFDNLDSTVLSEPDLLDIPDIEVPSSFQTPQYQAEETLDLEKPFDLGDFDLETETEPAMPEDTVSHDDAHYLENLKIPEDYIFDPHVASDELGLPVELINDFIGDFIQQAYEFKRELYEATIREDYNEVHLLSHKLKGVAANLRIENAFEALSIINNSTEQAEIEAHLKQLYRFVAKLEGKELPEFNPETPKAVSAPTAEAEPEQVTEKETFTLDDDIYDFDLVLDTEPEPKEEELMADMPISIEDDLFIDSPVSPEIDIPPLEDEPVAPPVEDELPVPSSVEGIEANEPDQRDAVQLRYDLVSASAELGLQADFVRELISDFVSDADSSRFDINEALENDNLASVQELAVELKGITDNLRITELSSVLQTLIHNNDISVAKNAVADFYNLIDQL